MKTSINIETLFTEPGNPQAIKVMVRYTAARIREPSSLEIIAWRADLGPWPYHLNGMVHLARERRFANPYTGQVLKQQHCKADRLYQELEPGVFEDVTDSLAARQADESAPTWYKNLQPLGDPNEPDSARSSDSPAT
jgi:hypothetical protein